jgi:hypothetical protein
MSKKRKTIAKDNLTGGSGDVNPQMFRVSGVFENSGSSGTIAELLDWVYFLLPTSPVQRSRPLVFELLKVIWGIDFPFVPENTTPDTPIVNRIATIEAFLSTAQFFTDVSSIQVSDPSIFAYQKVTTTWTDNPGVQNLAIGQNTYTQDFTDGAGHGILVASQQIALVCAMVGCNGNSDCTISAYMIYRFKEVGLEEYIGIVESQALSAPIGLG